MNKVITVKLNGNKNGIYIDPVTCNAYIDIKNAVNYSAIDFDGVNNVLIWREKDGTFFIAQAGGYTYERGAFCDLYDEDGLFKRGV